MVKRGEVKHNSRHHVRAPTSKKRDSLLPTPGMLSKGEVAEIKSAGRILAKEEKAIERGLNWAFGPQEFHVVSFIASMVILAFLLKSTSIIFYTVLSCGVLLFGHFLRQHNHHPHHVIKIIGLFFLPLFITMAVFRDFFVWLLLVIYIISAISTMIIYYHHKSKHSPVKVMWQVAYSRIVAITLALVVACILPYFILSDGFMSVFELIFAFVFPVSFVLFFASKFFYIYFFDRIHIKSDLVRSLRHSLIYTLVFIVLLMCMYSLFAVAFYNSEVSKRDADLDYSLVELANLEKSFDKGPGGVQRLMVSEELRSMISGLREEVDAEKNRISEQIAFSEIVDDSYFASLEQGSFNNVKFVVRAIKLGGVKQGIVSWYENITATADNNLTFYDGTRTLAEHNAKLKEQVDAFTPLSEAIAVQEIFSVVDDPSAKFSDYEDKGLYYWLSKDMALGFVYGSDSIFGRQMSLVLRHSSVFRELTRLFVHVVVFINIEGASPSSIERLYSSREADSSLLSSTIRYELIRQELLSRQQGISRSPAVFAK